MDLLQKMNEDASSNLFESKGEADQETRDAMVRVYALRLTEWACSDKGCRGVDDARHPYRSKVLALLASKLCDPRDLTEQVRDPRDLECLARETEEELSDNFDGEF